MESQMSSFTSAFASFTASLKPSMENMNRQFQQYSQLAKEKMSTNADVTDLPTEYKQLEDVSKINKKVDKLKHVYESFLKLTKNYTIPAHDYDPPTAEKLSDLASVVTAEATSLGLRFSGGPTPARASVVHHIPPTFAHAFAKVGFQAAEAVGTDEPFGIGLKKFAETQEKLGGLKVTHDKDAIMKIHAPFTNIMDTVIADAMKARDEVLACRLTYDSCRDRLKTCAPSRADEIRSEMAKSEDEFVSAVDVAMGKMKLLVDRGEPLKCLAELVAIQLNYHKAAYEALSILGPELDELVVTSEAIYTD